MARPLRLDESGAWHHVFNRGQRKEPIYATDHDRRTFLRLCSEVDDRFGLEITSYCLLDNHYHLLVHSRDGRLADAMRHIDGVYTQIYNRRHGHDGALFRGRYGSTLVQAEAYLTRLLIYIHRNPVEAGLVAEPTLYRWSSHRALTGRAPLPPWLSTRALAVADLEPQRLESLAASLPHDAQLHERLNTPKLAALGTDDWVANIESRRRSDHDRVAPPRDTSVETILSTVANHVGCAASELTTGGRGISNPHRRLAMWLTYRHSGLSHREIGHHFGLQPGGVAVTLARLRADPPDVPKAIEMSIGKT